MIRPAIESDLLPIISMVGRLHAATGQTLPIHNGYVRAFVSRLMTDPSGLALVCEADGFPVGMLLASIGRASVSPAPVAVEHGWWVDTHARGQGRALLTRYVEWAREHDCYAVRMSTAHLEDKAAMLLRKEGFAPAEIAWAKVL